MKAALIIGNGLSRLTWNLDTFKENFTTFGCNALYRTFTPDFLYAIDDVIIGEIITSNYPKERFIVPPVEEQYEPVEYNPSRPRENAGMVAMRDAIRRGHNSLVLIGMDFLIHDHDFNMGNIFDGTTGYGSDTRASFIDCIARSKYLEWTINKNPNVKFMATFPKEVLNNHKFRIAPKPNFNYAYL